jgi:predicted ATPase/signal transduction histidine kinase
MANISGFQLLDMLHESSNSRVYRARGEKDGRSVILKLLGPAYPSPEKIAWFRREYETTRGLSDVEGVIRAEALLHEQQRWTMVLEDFGGTSLAQLARQRRFSLDDVLAMACSLTAILGRLHARHVIHKDINPSNIVVNPLTGELKLIDFGISSVLSRESAASRPPKKREGTLPYMSPEQTGRMNRAVDYRTDFYSLGVTLYELVTGQLPFSSMDPLELVHAHLARQPLPPHEAREGVDRALSDLLMRLLAKNAEDRYQSAHGLLRDLEEYRRRRAGGDTAPFPLGREDVSDRFQLPQKLYGRGREQQLLHEAFQRVADGGSEVLLISGYSGVGKSALVREIHRPITRQRGYFTSGKFDQLQRDEPYAPLIQAFRGLVRQLFSEDEEGLARWRARLGEALGPNGRVITDVIPEVEVILGAQPPLVEVEPSEARHRFHRVFQGFIQVFARREHPLVLFVDDLQWVDGASLDLLQALLTGLERPQLLLIGAYRDNEVSEAHPLMQALERLKKAGVTVGELALQPLSEAHVLQLVSDALAREPGEVRPLAALAHAKTGGNPFFLGEFLKHLAAEELIRFDFQRGGWQWELEQIAARDVTDNVVDFMAGKVRRLGEASRQALQIAACMGSVFDLKTLALLLEQPPRRAAADLWDALVEGLVLPLDETYKLTGLDMQGLLDSVDVRYRFAHDRIQQAAYSLIADDERRRVHLRLGRMLRERTPEAELGQKLFDIIHQFDPGLELVVDRAERDALALLYLLAGRRAKASAAYEPALRYLRTGLWLLTEPDVVRDDVGPSAEQVKDAWGRVYTLCLDLFDEAAETACLLGEYAETQRRIDVVLPNARTLLDKLRSFKTEIQSHAARKQLLEGVSAGLRALAQFGVHIPASPVPDDLAGPGGAAAAAWAGRDIDSFIELPEMTDPEKRAAMEIMARLYIPAFNSSPLVFLLVVFNQVTLSLTHGVTASSSPRAFAAYGFMLCTQGDVASGYRFGVLAPRLADRFHGRDRSSTQFMFNFFVRHWRDDFRDSVEPCVESYRHGLESGDHEFAALSLIGALGMAFWSGRDLPSVAADGATYSRTIRHLKQELPQETNDIHWQTVRNLMGLSADPCMLVSDIYDEREKRPFYEATHNVTELAFLHTSKLLLHYLFGNLDEAVAHGQEGLKNAPGITSMVSLAGLFFYDALACLARHAESRGEGAAGLLARADAALEQLRVRERTAPRNYTHKVLLVEAERARALGQPAEARDRYDRSIRLAQRHGFIQEEALAHELAARFHQEQGHTHLARNYLRDAHHAYHQWGAQAKVQHLEARFPQELSRAALRILPVRSGPRGTTTQQLESAGALDVLSVLKASQALYGEIALDRLLAKLLTTVIENAGAQRACLLLQKQDGLFIEAEASVDGGEPRVLQSQPVASSDGVLPSIVNLVANLGGPQVTDNASEDDRYAHEPYVQRHRPRSILCMPLVNQGRPSAILYLENNRVAGAFNSERVALLNLLSSGMAIAIDNARLLRQVEVANKELEVYSRTLEDKVALRTRELSDKNQELQRTLEQLRETQEQLVLREKMASLGTLTAGIAHEMRNPLNFINNFAVLAKNQAEELAGELSVWLENPAPNRLAYIKEVIEDLSSNAAHIEQHGKRANGIVNSMLVHAQPSSERRIDTDLNQLVSQSVQLALHATRARDPGAGISILENYDLTLETLQVLPQELNRVFINILENACYTTSKKRQQRGASYEPRIWVNTVRREKTLEVVIRDNGQGIAKEHLDKIFQPFFTTKPPGEGTGLGLAICYDIVVRKHQGDIRVSTQEGESTEFTVVLPRTQG